MGFQTSTPHHLCLLIAFHYPHFKSACPATFHASGLVQMSLPYVTLLSLCMGTILDWGSTFFNIISSVACGTKGGMV